MSLLIISYFKVSADDHILVELNLNYANNK